MPLPDRLAHNDDVVLAYEVARRAGDFLAARPDVLHTETKTSDVDVVTHMDKASEAQIVQALRLARPHDGVLGEEGAAQPSESGRTWIIDPIDGTTNYLYDEPFWCVSVAVVDVAGPMVGVVDAPALASTYVAARGAGAWRIDLDGHHQRLAVSTMDSLERALVGTGFGYSSQRRAAQARVLTELLPVVRDIRRLGSCALDLCFVAEGKLDAYYERGVHVWDHAAGALVAREAGAEVTGLHGQPVSEEMCVAGGLVVHRLLRDILESAGADRD